jgi:DNA-binding response OmpR family regulator
MSKRVLIVDDSRHLADSICDLLLMSGYEVSIATNGESGIEMLKTSKPDLIITDMVMPKMNGIDFIAYVRSSVEFKDIPIIMLTAQVEPENRAAAENAGANVFMVKPFKESQLLGSIDSLLPRE